MTDETKQQIDRLTLENIIHKAVLKSILELLHKLHPELDIPNSHEAFYAETLLHHSNTIPLELAEYVENYFKSLSPPSA